MTQDAKPRVKVQKTAKVGEVINIKALISHLMESGQRKGSDGNLIPRSIINRFTCDVNGENVIDVAIEPAVSTNPYFEFEARIDADSDVVFTWYDDDASVYTNTQQVAIA